MNTKRPGPTYLDPAFRMHSHIDYLAVNDIHAKERTLLALLVMILYTYFAKMQDKMYKWNISGLKKTIEIRIKAFAIELNFSYHFVHLFVKQSQMVT